MRAKISDNARGVILQNSEVKGDIFFGIPHDELDKLLENASKGDRQALIELAKQQGVTEHLLRHLLERMGHENLPREKWASALDKVVEDYHAFQEKLHLLDPKDPETKKLVDSASKLADQGKLDQAKKLLAQAEERELAAARELADKAKARFLNAAKIQAARAKLLASEFKYQEAGELLQGAAELVKEWDEDARFYLLNEAALVFSRQGEEKGDPQALERAIHLWRETILPLVPRHQPPLDWAGIQNNLGVALRALGERESGTRRLEQAVAAHKEALKVHTRKQEPLRWAMTQNNLGVALGALGERESSTGRLEQAVNAFEQALKERTRERVPLDWATTQNNLGNALFRLGERERGTERLEQAVEAYEEALKEYTRERVPLDWAATQNNLGNALAVLGARESGTRRLVQAVKAYEQALKEWTRERVPMQWAMTQNNLGNALARLGEREQSSKRLEQAVEAYQNALEVYEEAGAQYYIDLVKSNLKACQDLLARFRAAGQAG